MISVFVLTLVSLVFGDAPPAETRIPIYRYWASSVGDHFYTRYFGELGEGNGVYTYEGIGFYLGESGCENSEPLYRYYKGTPTFDHFYTTSSDEIGITSTSEGVGNYGYSYEGILGYCYTEEFKRDDMVPLYRYWKASIGDHFYTTSLAEIGAGLSAGDYGNYNYRYEGVQCYVFASASATLEKEMKDNPINEEKRAKDMELFQGEHVNMPFSPINNNNGSLQLNYLIIGGLVVVITAFMIMMVWYKNKGKKEAGYQMLV